MHYPVLIVIEVLTSRNVQSQPCSIEVSLYWLGDLCCWHVLKMEVFLSLGLFRIACLLLLVFMSCNWYMVCSHCSVALEIQGYLTLRCSLKLSPRIHSIRASFCPLLSLDKGEYIGLYVQLNCHLEAFDSILKLKSIGSWCVVIQFFSKESYILPMGLL